MNTDKAKILNLENDEAEALYITREIRALVNNKTKLSEIAILTRASFQFKDIEDRFLKEGIKYRVVGGLRFYERKEIKDIIAYLRLTNNLSDDLAFERIINVPKRGIGKSTVSKISSYARMNNISLFESAQQLTFKGNSKAKGELYNFTDNILKWQKVKKKFDHIELAKVIIEDSGYLDYLKKEEENSNKPDSLSRIDNLNEFIESLKEFENIEGFLEHVSLVMENITNTSEETLTLMTMHAAKGLEFDYVFLAGWEEGVFPSQRSIEESGIRRRKKVGLCCTNESKKKNLYYLCKSK